MFIVHKKCIPHWSIKNTSYFAASDDKCSAADDVSAAHNTRPNNHAMSRIITIGTGTTVQSKNHSLKKNTGGTTEKGPVHLQKVITKLQLDYFMSLMSLGSTPFRVAMRRKFFLAISLSLFHSSRAFSARLLS